MILTKEARSQSHSNVASFRLDARTTALSNQKASKPKTDSRVTTLVEEEHHDIDSETEDTPTDEPKESPEQPELDSSGTLPTEETQATSPEQHRRLSFQKSQQTLNLKEHRNVAGPPPWVQPITYRERLGGYLHPRDMRRLVTPFSGSNEPELIVRRHVILLNFDPLRAIVLRDRLLILVPDGADSILETLAKRIKGGMTEMEASVFGDEHMGHAPHADVNMNEVAHKIADVITGHPEVMANPLVTQTNDPNESAPLTSNSSSLRKSKKDGKKRLQTIANFEKYISDDEGDNGDEEVGRL